MQNTPLDKYYRRRTNKKIRNAIISALITGSLLIIVGRFLTNTPDQAKFMFLLAIIMGVAIFYFKSQSSLNGAKSSKNHWMTNTYPYLKNMFNFTIG